jgi:hypothetical protein
MTEATVPPSSPTATQVVELGDEFGAQETALTLASGVKLAVLCQVGTTVLAAAPGPTVQIATPTRAQRATSVVDSAATVVPVTLRIASTAASLPHGEPCQ